MKLKERSAWILRGYRDAMEYFADHSKDAYRSCPCCICEHNLSDTTPGCDGICEEDRLYRDGHWSGLMDSIKKGKKR